MKFRNLSIFLLLFMLLSLSFGVKADSDHISKILKNGKLEIQSVYDEDRAIDYLEYYLSHKFGSGYSVKGTYNDVTEKYEYECNKSYSECTIVFEDYDSNISEEKKVGIVWHYDRDIKEMVDKILRNVSNSQTTFTLNEIETIKYLLDNGISSFENVEGNNLMEYSSELKNNFGNYNFKLILQGGLFSQFGVMVGGAVSFEYGNTVYALLDNYNVMINYVLYVDDNENNIKEALENRLSKYFDGIRVEKSITKNQYMEQYFNNIRDTFNTCKTLLDEYDLTQPQEETCGDQCTIDEWERKRNDYLARMNLWTAQRDKIMYKNQKCSYFDGYNVDEYMNEEMESLNNEISDSNSFLGYINDSIDDMYTLIFNDGRKYDFFVKKDSSKVFNEELEFILADIKTGIIVSTTGVIPPDTLIEVVETTEGEKFDRIANILKNDNIEVFEIKLFSKSVDGYITKLNDGLFKIRIPLSEKLTGKDLIIYYIDENDIIEPYQVTIEDGFAVFYTDHFSTYVLAEVNNSAVPNTKDNIANSIIILFISVIGLSIIYLKNKQRN